MDFRLDAVQQAKGVRLGSNQLSWERCNAKALLWISMPLALILLDLEQIDFMSMDVNEVSRTIVYVPTDFARGRVHI
jgi:hypothetical protein